MFGRIYKILISFEKKKLSNFPFDIFTFNYHENYSSGGVQSDIRYEWQFAFKAEVIEEVSLFSVQLEVTTSQRMKFH